MNCNMDTVQLGVTNYETDLESKVVVTVSWKKSRVGTDSHTVDFSLRRRMTTGLTSQE